MSKILKLTNIFVFISLWLVIILGFFYVVKNTDSKKIENNQDSIIIDKLNYIIELEEEQNDIIYDLNDKVDSNLIQQNKMDKIQNKRLFLLESIQY